MKIGFIGAGNMGGALATAAKKTSHEILLSDASSNKAEALANAISAKAVTSKEICEYADMIFLGVKPQVLDKVAKEILPYFKNRKSLPVLVSMAAAVSIERLSVLFPDFPIIRIMPNTPVSVGAGMILYTLGEGVSEDDEALFTGVLKFAGTLDKIDEKLIDAASAVSGCGPAFVYMFIDALADGGVKCGLPRDKALKYASAAVLGAAKLQLESGIHPDVLKDAVCSPGGTTIAGVAALEKGAFRSSGINAVESAYKRTLELTSKK